MIHMPVSWKLVVINCFLTAAEDFILCVMAAVVARRLMPLHWAVSMENDIYEK